MKKISTLNSIPTTDEVAERPHRYWRWQFRFSERRLLLMIGDVVACVSSVGIALLLWAHNASITFDAGFLLLHVYWFAILPTLWFLLASANGYYSLAVAARVRASLLRLAQITAQLLILYVLVFFLSPPGSLPRRFIFYYAAISLVALGIWRACRLAVVGWPGLRRRVVIVGAGSAAQSIFSALQEEAVADYHVVGQVTSSFDRLLSRGEVEGLRFLGDVEKLPTIIHDQGITELVMAYINEVPEDVFQAVMTCHEQGVTVVSMPVLYEQITGKVSVDQLETRLWELALPPPAHVVSYNLYGVTKRLMDILLALIGLLVFFAVLPVLALVIVLDSRGPVFYSQTRLGRGGRPFNVHKLRTMVKTAEQESGPRWASDNDPRVTRVGRFLRRTRLDEFPQLLNVLKGEMSIVGPRPERPMFVKQLAEEIPFYRARLAVKPGLTGWAQVRYRYGSTVEDARQKLQFDLFYIRHQSIVLDIIIMLRTISTMLLFKGT